MRDGAEEGNGEELVEHGHFLVCCWPRYPFFLSRVRNKSRSSHPIDCSRLRTMSKKGISISSFVRTFPLKADAANLFNQSLHPFRSSPFLSVHSSSLSPAMRSPISLLVPILSFISFVVAVPFHASSPSSRLAKNHVSTRQFHYPRTLGDVCADIDLSLIPKGVDLGTCLCLSAFPLNLDLSLADSFVEANLKTLVRHSVLSFLPRILMVSKGRKQWYPMHLPSQCRPPLLLWKSMRLRLYRRLC